MGMPVTKEELGGAQIHAHGSLVVDNEATGEDDAFEQIRRFLSYMPQNVWQMPPRVAANDDPNRHEEALLSIVPRNRRRPYNARNLIELIVDRDSFFEIGRYQGPALITGLARFNGYPVAVLASDPLVYGGGLDAPASDKLTRFVDIADTFHLPVVNLVDQPGFVIGIAAEKAGTIRKGATAMAAIYQATVPWAAVMVRRAYGVAGAAHMNHSRFNLRVAWPSGDWGSLPIEGGIEAAYRRDLENAADAATLRAEIEQQLNQVRSPFRVAEAFGVEEIIDPRETRAVLCDWIELAYEVESTRLGPKRRGVRC